MCQCEYYVMDQSGSHVSCHSCVLAFSYCLCEISWLETQSFFEETGILSFFSKLTCCLGMATRKSKNLGKQRAALVCTAWIRTIVRDPCVSHGYLLDLVLKYYPKHLWQMHGVIPSSSKSNARKYDYLIKLLMIGDAGPFPLAWCLVTNWC